MASLLFFIISSFHFNLMHIRLIIYYDYCNENISKLFGKNVKNAMDQELFFEIIFNRLDIIQ